MSHTTICTLTPVVFKMWCQCWMLRVSKPLQKPSIERQWFSCKNCTGSTLTPVTKDWNTCSSYKWLVLVYRLNKNKWERTYSSGDQKVQANWQVECTNFWRDGRAPSIWKELLGNRINKLRLVLSLGVLKQYNGNSQNVVITNNISRVSLIVRAVNWSWLCMVGRAIRTKCSPHIFDQWITKHH